MTRHETRSARKPVALLLRTGLLLVVLTSLFAAAPAGAREETDPFSLGDAYPPRAVVLDVASPPAVGDVRLTDAAGRPIPLTGEGVAVVDGEVVVFPPRLPAGRYTIAYPGGQQVLEIGTVPGFQGDAAEGPSPFRFLPLLVLLPALLLVLRRRPLVGGMVAFVGVASTAGLLALTGADRSALPQGDPCAGRPDLTECATGYVVEVLEGFGPRRATEELVRLSGGEGSSWARICHEPAHELGIRTWLREGSLEAAVDAGTTACSLGYVHGLLQAMGTYLDDEEFPGAARGLCDGIDDLYRSGRLVGDVANGPATLLGCHHGVGHAAMWRFNEDLASAMPVCAEFPLPEQQEECRVGAVMEWVYASQRAARSGVVADRPSPQVETPVDLCLPPIGVLSPGCVEGAVTAVGPDGIDATRAWCAEHPDVLSACVQSLARRMVQMDLSNAAPLLASAGEFCASFDGLYPSADCAERFGYMLLFLSRDLDRTEAFCSSLPDLQADGCRKGIEKVLEYARKTGDTSFNEILAEAKG